MKPTVVCLVLVAALGACEDSAAKAARLRQEEGASGLLAWYATKQYNEGTTRRPKTHADSVRHDSLYREMAKASATHDAALRELNRFVGGR